MNYTQDSQFLDVLKSIFPDAHTLSGTMVKLQSRVKSTGADLRAADFCGRIEDHSELGTVKEFTDKSLSLTFECSYGKILITTKKEECLHFHPLELLELTRGPEAIKLVMEMKNLFQASVVFPSKIKEKINPYAVKKTDI